MQIEPLDSEINQALLKLQTCRGLIAAGSLDIA